MQVPFIGEVLKVREEVLEQLIGETFFVEQGYCECRIVPEEH